MISRKRWVPLWVTCFIEDDECLPVVPRVKQSLLPVANEVIELLVKYLAAATTTTARTLPSSECLERVLLVFLLVMWWMWLPHLPLLPTNPADEWRWLPHFHLDCSFGERYNFAKRVMVVPLVLEQQDITAGKIQWRKAGIIMNSTKEIRQTLYKQLNNINGTNSKKKKRRFAAGKKRMKRLYLSIIVSFSVEQSKTLLLSTSRQRKSAFAGS